MPGLEVALLPSEALDIGGDCFVVVDVLRATTTMATLFGRGLRDLVVVDTIEAARERARASGSILLGEVRGLAPEGFDYGNSPTEISAVSLEGKDAVHFTTNGTRALCGLAGQGAVFAGAIANCGAIAGAAAGFERVVIVCAGQAAGLRFGQDDFFAAGAIARRIAAENGDVTLGDAARLAIELASPPERLAAGLRDSEHGRYTAGIGFGADIDFALQPDTSNAAPRVVEWGPGWARLVAN